MMEYDISEEIDTAIEARVYEQTQLIGGVFDKCAVCGVVLCCGCRLRRCVDHTTVGCCCLRCFQRSRVAAPDQAEQNQYHCITCKERLRRPKRLGHLMDSLENLQLRLSFLRNWKFNPSNDDDETIKLHSSDGAIFTVHRSVLASRSYAFKAMLSAGMRESSTGEIQLNDMEAAPLKAFLGFLYTASVSGEDLRAYCGELLQAANRYELDLLKKICEGFVLKAMDANNVVENLKLGYLGESTAIKNSALQIISSNYNHFHSQETMRQLQKYYPSIACELYKNIIALQSGGDLEVEWSDES